LLRPALLLPALLLAGVAASCSAPQPSRASLAAEPVLERLPGEVELADVRVQPRKSRIGVPGRDGVIERVVAVDLSPAAAADLVQQRHGERYGFTRVELGGGSPVTVEMRGTAPTGAVVIVTASTQAPVPLYGGPDEVRPVPPNLATTLVITVVSAQ
jgi:hypothetical protein